jgi:hypothetical protein
MRRPENPPAKVPDRRAVLFSPDASRGSLLEAAFLDFVGDKLLELFNVLLILGFELFPELSQAVVAFRVGKVLIMSPHGVKPAAQFVDQVMIVILATARFADVLVAFLRHCN